MLGLGLSFSVGVSIRVVNVLMLPNDRHVSQAFSNGMFRISVHKLTRF